MLTDKLIMYINNSIETKGYKFTSLLDKLETLSPIKTLKRGYSITKVNDKIITTINNLKKGDVIKTTLENGNITSKIMEVEHGK